MKKCEWKIIIKHPYTYKLIRNIVSSLAKGENLPFLKREDCHPRLYTGTYISFIKDFHKRTWFYTENDTHLEHRPSRPIVPQTVAVSGTGSLRWWWSPGLVCKELNNIDRNIKNKWNWKQNFFTEYKMFLTSSLKWY